MSALPTEALIAQLRQTLGDAAVVTDRTRRELLSTDFYAAGATCAAVIRPAGTAALSRAAALITGAGHALVPRGGGMSYTGGYTPASDRSVVVDLGAMHRILDLRPADMTITVQAGATWEAIYQALAPLGLRLPFFGTFSGRLATVGGGLSNGALFFGTARHGGAADNVLGLEVVCADGRVLRTGQAAFRNGQPFYRTNGPDLTGLFVHDCGALGIKTEATFRLMEMPRRSECLSFALADAGRAAAALSAVARSGAVEEAYVFDPAATARNLQGGNLRQDLARLGSIVKGQGSAWKGLRAGARVIRTGRRVVPAGAWSLHVVCAGRSDAAVQADADLCRARVADHGGQEIANSIPLAVRAAPFDNLNGVLGPAGERWVALNAKVPHGQAATVIERFAALQAGYQQRLDAAGVMTSRLFTAIDTHAFSFEPVFHWRDRWLPTHRAVADPGHLASLTEPPPNPAAEALVAELRERTLEMFSELGAASNQIGRTYPWRDNLEPGAGALFDALKAEVDALGLMNPGVLARRHIG